MTGYNDVMYADECHKYEDPEQTDNCGGQKGYIDVKDPKRISGMQRRKSAHRDTLELDRDGAPLNPVGLCGVRGRGLLNKWGPNWCVDVIVTMIGADGATQVACLAGDNGDKKLPGVVQRSGEDMYQAAMRCIETKLVAGSEEGPSKPKLHAIGSRVGALVAALRGVESGLGRVAGGEGRTP